jgi:ribonuclease PH
VGDCDGSALVVQGLTKVVASVHGPREVARRGPADSAEHAQRQAVVRCEVSQAAFSTADRRRRRQPPAVWEIGANCPCYLAAVSASAIRRRVLATP